MGEETFSLADMVILSVSICQIICCHCLARVNLQYVLFSNLYYGPRCPLQAPIGYHFLYVHQGQQSTPLTIILRRTGSHRWAHGSGLGNLV